MIEITTRDELGPINRSDWLDGCDTVIGFGHDLAAISMAQLLLNASLDDVEDDEYDLEGDVGGYPSVATGSAELGIWLPGGLGYIDSDD